MMKKLYIICLFLLCGLTVLAQDFEITSVEYLPMDGTAINEKMTEPGNNGRECAVIRIATQHLTPEQRENFNFEPDWGSKVVQRADRDGEIWLWVSPGMQHLRIKGGKMGQDEVHFMNYSIRIESCHTYKIVLRGKGKIDDKQYLKFEVSPADAVLKVEGEKWALDRDGTSIRELNLGTYHYSVTAPNYYSDSAAVTLDNPRERKIVHVKLKTRFPRVTLIVDRDAEILINKEYKSMRIWTGRLGCGEYDIECKAGDEKSKTRISITSKMDGDTIKLPLPKPYGTLNVTSEPSGAYIYLDGESKNKTTPYSFDDVPVGDHTLRLEKEGCAPSIKNINIKKGRTTEVNEKLDSGRSVKVFTDREGDKVYVDGDYKGVTPLDVTLGFGKHIITVRRGEREMEKTVTIDQAKKSQEIPQFVFDRLITIHTVPIGAEIRVDGNSIGSSPVAVDLEEGNYTIKASLNNKSAEMDIEVKKVGGKDTYNLVLRGQPLRDYVKDGVGFFTVDGASSLREFGQPSFGFTIGFVNVVGVYFSAMSNFRFDAMKAPLSCDSNGLVNGMYPEYTGKTSNFRLSVMGGILVDCNSPCCIRVGAGYGMRTRCLEIADGSLVKVEDNCFSTVDLSAGVQFNLKGFTLSVDALSSCFKTIEMKVGIGYCWQMN